MIYIIIIIIVIIIINIYYYYYYLIIIVIYIIIPKINFPLLLFILISMNYLSVHRSTPWAAFRIRKKPHNSYIICQTSK